jgi:hypothetical protein
MHAQVALLFLTRDWLPYEPVWRAFLATVPDLGAGGQAGRAWQLLFSLYAHSPPSNKWGTDSIFWNREVPDRVKVEWGQWSVVRPSLQPRSACFDPLNVDVLYGLPTPRSSDALCSRRAGSSHPVMRQGKATWVAAGARRLRARVAYVMHACWRAQVAAEKLLLRAALQDPANARFALLSETCVPLYPAPVVWAQLQGEPRSRLNGCARPEAPGDEDARMSYR